MDTNTDDKLSILINQNKLVLEKLEQIEKRLDRIENSTKNMDSHIDEINVIYSNYRNCLDFVNNKYETCCKSLKYISS
jgi:archaellum component FlaC